MRFIIVFLLISFSIPASEIDQFTDREKYQDIASDFTEQLNLQTNKLIINSVNNYNNKYHNQNLTQQEIHNYISFEIYKTTAGATYERYGFFIPSKIDFFYALFNKSGLGPLQKWIISEDNNHYWINLSKNIYSDIYPEGLNQNYIIKVGGEFVGPDKIDHFFDQGYSYWIKSECGRNDLEAKNFGIDSENGWYGLLSGGVFSFGDLRANWGGYQFYKSLFLGEKSHLQVSDDGFVSIRRAFDWNEHIDWQYDELKNPSLYSNENMKMIYRSFQKNIVSFNKTYEYLENNKIFSWLDKRETFYLTDDFELVNLNFFDLKELYSEL